MVADTTYCIFGSFISKISFEAHVICGFNLQLLVYLIKMTLGSILLRKVKEEEFTILFIIIFSAIIEVS